ncbi:Protein of unknown function [Gryllus bimaculatus]|nr:Protein of unknown function [Gryllus bimaculatus]
MALKGTVVARAAIVVVLCVLIDARSEERQAATLFSFSISSRRNSTGHRHIRAFFSTPDPIFSRNAGGDETLFDVKQNINIEGNKKVIQLISSVVGETLQEAGFDSWNSGQPNNHNDHCGTISKAEGELYDTDCAQKHFYFCEFQL